MPGQSSIELRHFPVVDNSIVSLTRIQPSLWRKKLDPMCTYYNRIRVLESPYILYWITSLLTTGRGALHFCIKLRHPSVKCTGPYKFVWEQGQGAQTGEKSPKILESN